VSIDAHQHPASKLAAVADHLLTALRTLLYRKEKTKKTDILVLGGGFLIIDAGEY